MDGGSGSQAAVLCLTLPPSYPSLSPPSYSYSAPFLSSRDKQELEAGLQEVYLEHMGESLLYLWVEKVREMLETDKEDLETEEMTDCDTEVVPELVTAPCPAIVTGPVLEDRRSVFQGHTARVTSIQEVAAVMDQLHRNSKVARATHNMSAYRIRVEGREGAFLQDCQDDGEEAAGGRMLHLLQVLDVVDVLVVVSRWYGGVHLGPDRFKHINNSARQVLELAGVLGERQGKKKGK